ncbi:MAG: PHP domain-containing protein [candidate division WOR-3 bacterium]
MYIPLLYHSNYGLGGSDFRTLFEILKKYHISACGIVDDTFFGLNEFLTLAKEYSIKPIIGSRISVSTRSRNFSPVEKATFYLFIKNKTGYSNLCQILTSNAFKNLDIQTIKKYSAGLGLVSNSEKLLEEIADAFSDIYFLLVPGSNILPKKHIPVIAANEIFYANPQERIIYRLLSVIKKFNSEDNKKLPYHIISPERFNKLYRQYPQAIKNLFKFAQMCDYRPVPGTWIFPQTGKKLIEIIRPRTHNLTREERHRLEFEYRVIKEMGFEPYFVLIYELKEFARSKGIGMNVRGSAASSFILYLLGISVVNPMKYNLPFERFLNQKRSEPPDIDVDVEYNQREFLLGEIYKKFGNDYVARISMINRFQTRARFRDTARAYGISPLELKKIKEHLGEKLIGEILRISERIDNYPHYFSCHPSGIVITPEPVFKYAPLYPSPQGPITHFDKDGIGIAGLVKLDILGVRGFPELYLKKEIIDFDNRSVYKFISEGKTLGCFQIESPMVRQVLKKIKPANLMDIANAIAIIRPGPAHGGMKERFLRRLKGEEKVEYPHSVLESSLKETLGIPVYQEQILNMANSFAGFSLEDADLLRRAITKERDTNLINQIKEKFFNQAQAFGFTKKEIERVWQRISAFSSFGFNKAHSITYATLAYLSAYQKFYNPLEFFCRLLNNEGGYYPLYAYINETRRWGIKIVDPDINQSDCGFSINKGSLITGLNRIRNLSFPTIQKIIQYRPFKSADQFFSVVHPDIEEGDGLIKSGALNLFGEPHSKLYFMLLQSSSRSKDQKTTTGQKFFLKEDLSALPFRDFNQKTKLRAQFSTLGFLPGQHILEFLYPERRVRISDIRSTLKIVQLTCLVISRRTILARNKKIMSFLAIDDETGVLDAILFPEPNQLKPKSLILKIKGYLKNDCLYAQSVA